MNLSERLMRLRCPSCTWSRVIGPEEMLIQLRAVGMLRRDAKPDPKLVAELFTNHTQNIRCQECRESGLILEAFADEQNWGDTVYCDVCQKPIPPERLEIFPNETVCASCKDKPSHEIEPEYCRQCGGILKPSSNRGAGISRYRMVCSDCGRG